MTAVRIIFEAIPVVLAVLAIFSCVDRALRTRRMHDRNVYLLMTVCAALMIGAQSSWTYSLLKGDLFGTDMANVLWSLFNALTMASFIYSSRRSK